MLTRDEAIDQLTAPGGAFELLSVPDGFGGEHTVYAGGPATLRDVLELARGHGDREFLIYEDERVTYATFYARTMALAHWLQGQGVTKGERVAIGMRNYPEWAVGFFATQAIGAVAVTLNAWWTGQELLYGLNDSATALAILDDERYRSLEPLRADLTTSRFLVTRDQENRTDVPRFDEVTNASITTGLPDVQVASTDFSSIMYTSGTTGFPKGALHTHLNHVTNLKNMMLSAAASALLTGTAPDPSAQPSSLQTFPFFHIGGLSGLYAAALAGSKLALMYKWDAERAMDLIEREQITSWAGVPTVVRQVLEHPRAETGALASLLSVGSGGAPVPEDLINRVGDLFQARVSPSNGYGATETTSAVIANGGHEYLDRPASVGRPVVTADVRIVDDAGVEQGANEIGELWIKGANVFTEYWNKPTETAAALENGWYKTGDLGFVDADGYYHVVDRKKDMIIRGGENVYCAEVEGVLHQLDAIADVALIGLPERSLGEEVAAVVELKPGAALSEADVQNHVAANLARFNVPTKVFFIAEPLPRNATGKILKRELKQRYGG